MSLSFPATLLVWKFQNGVRFMLLPVRRIKATLLCLLICTGLSCTDVTEVDMIWESSLLLFSAEDLSLIASFPEIKSPRCFMIYPGMIFVASAEGTVYALDAESHEITGEYKVGPASPSGYCRMIFSPSEGTAYLIGAMGSILELSIPDCEVLDELHVCSAPFDLEITDGNPGYLWVADAMSNAIFLVKLSGNQQSGRVNYPDETVLQCMETSPGNDTLIVGTSILVYRLELLNGLTLRNTPLPEPTGSFESISAIPDTTSYIAVKDNIVGQLNPFGMSGVPPQNPYIHTESIPGLIHMTAPANNGRHMIILSYSGNGISMLASYDYVWPIGIDNTAEFEGFPLDFQASGDGNLYVLTY